ncbi:MAG: PIN domain-containing protein, partial [Bacteroidales bacterium]
MGTKKNFIIDTNVILHDSSCLEKFQENDVYIPIVVLEELDKFKKGNDVINFNAREFIRYLDEITGDDLFKKGASLGEGRGKLFIYLINELSPEVQKAFQGKTSDNYILSATLELASKNKTS